MRNLVFILGAGASFDSKPETVRGHDAYRPPLAKDLFRTDFDPHISRYQRLRGDVARLRSFDEGSSFEDFLYNEIFLKKDRTHRALQLMEMRFYLREVLSECSTHYLQHGGNNYSNFIGSLLDLDDISVTFITFNYDTLLEKAMGDVLDYKFNKIDDYTEHPIKLIKLHGSTNWVTKIYRGPITTVNHAQVLLANIAEVESNTRYGVIMISDDMNLIHSEYFHAPIIAIPVKQKTQFSCPDSHLEIAKNALSEADYLFTIGWRGMDQHFGKILVDQYNNTTGKVPKIFVVSNSDSNKIDALLRTYFTPRESTLFDGGFSNFVKKYSSTALNLLLT